MKRYLAFVLVTCLAAGALAGGLKVESPGFSASVARTITAVWNFSGAARITGLFSFTTGAGLEFGYSAPDAYVVAYDRDGASYKTLHLNGSPVQIAESGGYSQINGDLVLKGNTGTELRALSPQLFGALRTNTTTWEVCIGTGTGQGAWAMLRSTTTACDNG
jgi:hypothetical protein